jgi:hypothetical protein
VQGKWWDKITGIMRVGKNELTNEAEIYLSPEEAEDLKEIIRSARLDKARTFYKILKEL